MQIRGLLVVHSSAGAALHPPLGEKPKAKTGYFRISPFHLPSGGVALTKTQIESGASTFRVHSKSRQLEKEFNDLNQDIERSQISV